MNDIYKHNETVVIIDKVRFMRSKNAQYCIFHDTTRENTENLIPLNRKHSTPYFTFPEELNDSLSLICTKMDESGYCMGHPIEKQDFIEIFCEGKVPQTLEESVKEEVRRRKNDELSV